MLLFRSADCRLVSQYMHLPCANQCFIAVGCMPVHGRCINVAHLLFYYAESMHTNLWGRFVHKVVMGRFNLPRSKLIFLKNRLHTAVEVHGLAGGPLRYLYCIKRFKKALLNCISIMIHMYLYNNAHV